jgi:hypothetical protein
LHSGEFGVGAASALQGDDQRDGLALWGVVETCRLLDSVVFHDEVFGLQSVDDSALLVFDQGGNDDDVGLRTESCILGMGDAAKQR